MIRAGVDGCSGGWFAIIAEPGQGNTGVVFDRFDDLQNALPGAQILVDMPIGLLDSEVRAVEGMARRLLGRRHSSVFPVPCRAAVYAGSYDRACEINHRQLGRRLSKQTWNICPRIRELDQSLRRGRSDINESHPELDFALLAGHELKHGKKTAAGIEERLCILESVLPDCRSHFEQICMAYPRRQLARDDIVDGMVLLATALSPVVTLKGPVQLDRYGRAAQLIIPAGPARAAIPGAR